MKLIPGSLGLSDEVDRDEGGMQSISFVLKEWTTPNIMVFFWITRIQDFCRAPG